MDVYISYSIAVFVIVFLSGLIVNLLEKHYIFQLLGIAFFFMYTILKSLSILNIDDNISFKEFYITSLPMLMGIAACLISMVLGFWLFPTIRDRFKD